MNQKDVARVIKLLQGQYGTADDNRISTYRFALKDQDAEQIHKAAASWLRGEEARYGWPAPGDLIKLAALARRDAKKRPTPAKLLTEVLSHDTTKNTELYHEIGYPFILLPAVGSDGRPLYSGPLPVMSPMAVTPGTLNVYGMVCQRPEEWTKSYTAKAEIPPCMACYDDREIENCTLDQIRECARDFVGLKRPKTPGHVASGVNLDGRSP